MGWSKLILLPLTLLITASALGQDRFLRDCENRKTAKDAEYGWLKHHFKSEDCKEIANGLSKVKSFNEFLPPFVKEHPKLPGSWTNVFPEIYGLKSKYDNKDVSRILRGHRINYSKLFKSPELYKEFKNITMIDFSNLYKKGVCEILRDIPHIKTAIVDWSSLEDISKCGSVSSLPDLIIKDYVGSGKEEFASKVIGIESFVGRTTHLQGYPNLKYIGFNNFHGDIQGFITNQNITHLSMNATSSRIENIADISEMHNLSYLSLTCIKNENDFQKNPETKLQLCDDPYLTDISFIENFEWLEHLNFSYSGLKDVSILETMKNLKSIDVSNNNLAELPDFSGHSELIHLDVSNNPVESR